MPAMPWRLARYCTLAQLLKALDVAARLENLKIPAGNEWRC
jgi:hypothetical protein